MAAEDRISEVLGPLVAEMRERMFVPEFAAQQSDAKVLGMIVSKFLRWDGDAVLEASAAALVDSNFDDEAAQVAAIAAGVR